MARYIDADKMIDGYSTTFPYDLSYCDDGDLMEWLDAQPTADVVPKSEVEALKHQLEIIADEGEYWEGKYLVARSTVAREIFEEIEDIIKNWEFDHCSKETGYFVRKSYNGTMIVKCLAELKKKYTESEGEE